MLQKPWISLRKYELFKYSRKVKGKKRCTFLQRHWLSEIMWMAYSAVKNRSFCKYCVLFAPKSVGGSSLGLHLEKGFSRAQCYTNGRWYLCEHAKKEYHWTAVIECEQFLDSPSIWYNRLRPYQ